MRDEYEKLNERRLFFENEIVKITEDMRQLEQAYTVGDVTRREYERYRLQDERLLDSASESLNEVTALISELDEGKKTLSDSLVIESVDEPEVLLRGYYDRKLPTPQAAFSQRYGIPFNPDEYEILWHGADDDGYDNPITEYVIVRKQKENALEDGNTEEEIEEPEIVDDQEVVEEIEDPKIIDNQEEKDIDNNKNIEDIDNKNIKNFDIKNHKEIFPFFIPIKNNNNDEDKKNKIKDGNNDFVPPVVLNDKDKDKEKEIKDNSSSSFVPPIVLNKKRNYPYPTNPSVVPGNVIGNNNNKGNVGNNNAPIDVSFLPDDGIDKGNEDNKKSKSKSIRDALSSYMNKPSKKNKRKKVTKRRHSKVNLLGVLSAIVMTIVFAFGYVGDKAKEITRTITSQDATYSISEETTEPVYESVEAAVKRELAKMETGDKVTMEKGIVYHESSDYDFGGKNNTGEFGGVIREEGEYIVEYISIVDPSTGKIEKVEYNEGVKIEEFIDAYCQASGKSRDELIFRVHIGGPVSGWIEYDDYAKNINANPQKLYDAVTVTDHADYVEDFTGTVEFIENGERVIVNFQKPDGSYYGPNEYVTGSNGQTYKINILNIEEDVTTITEPGVPGKKHLTFSLANINNIEKFIIGATAILGTLATYRRKEEEIDVDDLDDYIDAEGYKRTKPGSKWAAKKTEFGKFPRIDAYRLSNDYEVSYDDYEYDYDHDSDEVNIRR